MLQGFFQIVLTLLLVVLVTPILGGYLAQIFMAKRSFLDPVMQPVERLIYLLGGVEPEEDMTGWQYTQAILVSNTAVATLVFLLLMFQGWLPLNPTGLGMPTWDTALHTAISFLVNADLQHYLPETTMSYLSQIAALGFSMFMSPATGIAVGIAFIRGLTGRQLGNFYVDLTRSITRVLLPISIVGAVLLIIASRKLWQVNSLLGGQQPNLEGKEVRLGWSETALFAITTTGTMTGSANGMFDSLMPPGGFSALFNLFVQVIWGSEGTGTATLFIYLFLAVFLTGLMVGRTPEFLGRKIEQRQITLVSVILLIHPLLILIPSAITLAFPETLSGITNPSFHGISQVVYEYASAAANNGSGFEGLLDSQPAPTALWWNLSTIVIWSGRFMPIAALLLLADSMSRKQSTPETTATLRTDTILFTGVTAGTILILGVLTFLPVLVLGPIAEAFQLVTGR